MNFVVPHNFLCIIIGGTLNTWQR